MGQVKNADTRYYPCQPPHFSLKGIHPDWEMHPSWISGIEALNSYNFWVSEVVLPIAFQWIEEHHDEVYAKVDPAHKADVGVVIAAAFDLIKNLSAYQTGLAASKTYEVSLTEGTFDSAQTNPVWTEIVKGVRKATHEKFEEQAPYLKDTIR